jgi:Protein of unknown function (DUF3072)
MDTTRGTSTARKPHEAPDPTPERSNTIKARGLAHGRCAHDGREQSYLHTLASEAGRRSDRELTKAEASKRSKEVQEKTGRGKGSER